MNFFKDSLGIQPWHLSRLERAEDFGVILVIYLGVDRGSMLSFIAVLCLYLCGVHDMLVAVVLSLARCTRLLVDSVHLSGKLPLMIYLVSAICGKLTGDFVAVC